MNLTPGGTLEDHDTKIKAATAGQHSKELRIIEDLLTCCLRGFTRLGAFTPTGDNQLQHAQLLLATRSFNSVRCAHELMQPGYYSQALTLIRSAMEDNLTALDCAECEATLRALLVGEGRLGQGKLTYTEMAKRQGAGVHKAWKNNYGGLSEYAAHARRKSLMVLVDPATHNLRLGSYYDRVLFIATCDSLLLAAIGTADIISKVLSGDAEPWQRECLPKLEAAIKWRQQIKAKVEAQEDV